MGKPERITTLRDLGLGLEAEQRIRHHVYEGGDRVPGVCKCNACLLLPILDQTLGRLHQFENAEGLEARMVCLEARVTLLENWRDAISRWSDEVTGLIEATGGIVQKVRDMIPRGQREKG